MLTLEKLKEYDLYKGFYDGFYMQKVENKTNINSNEDWFFIENLFQDFLLIYKGLASDAYSISREREFVKNCDSQETLEYFRSMVKRKSERDK